MTDPLRIGIVGVGALALRGLLPHLTMDDVADRVRVQALCDPALPRARAAAERFGVPAAYASLEQLLADDAVDAVTVATPIGLHFEHCRLALEAGKHVHANKTMTTTVAEADALIALAEAKGLRLVASPGEAARPQVRRTRELIAEGAIGRVAWAVCGGSFGRYHEDEAERQGAPGGDAIDPSWYFRRPGGGPLYDITVYGLHSLTSVLGPARRVTAVSGIRVPVRDFLGREVRTETDDNTVILADFGDGLVAVVHGTAAGHVVGQAHAAVYFGTAGSIDGGLLNGEPFAFPGRTPEQQAAPQDRELGTGALPHVVGGHRGVSEGHVFEDVMQLVRWVREGTAAAGTAEQARHVIDIIESAYRAAETGQAQDLRTTFALPQ